MLTRLDVPGRSSVAAGEADSLRAARIPHWICAFARKLMLLTSTLACGSAAVAMPNVSPPQAEIFMPGIISGGANDGAPTFSPDGSTLYFERTNGRWAAILVARKKGSGWGRPKLAEFSGHFSDQQPAFSPDGKYLIFVSTRPRESECVGCPKDVSHLYRVDRTPTGWTAPHELPPEVNFRDRIFKPSVAANGDLYFMADIGASGTKWRLFRSRRGGAGYAAAEALEFSGENDGDVDPYIARDQSFVIFSSNHRGDRPDGHEHLYIVRRQSDGWSAAEQLHYEGEGPWDDGEASVSPDGQWLYFTSARTVAGRKERGRAAALRDLSAIERWDNSNNNVWRVSISAARSQRTIQDN
ncbi:PD40 domain-containing protein [Mesorhizobium loti]|nr:PD40 domain-containing protein [Mesorhizobium loti]